MIVRNEYELTITARCPVDQRRDSYLVIVRADRTVMAEDIVAACKTLEGEPKTQEDITAALCMLLNAEVELRGVHSGVTARTLCRSGE